MAFTRSSSGLLIPQKVQGRAVGDHLQRVLRTGDSTVGWSGDPYLTLCFNNQTNEWEVWDEKANKKGRPILVGKWHKGTPVNDILRDLRDGDCRGSQTTLDILDKIDAHNERVEKEWDEKNQGELSEAIDRLAHGIEKDIGHHLPLPKAKRHS